MKVVIVTKASGQNFSLEAGLADGACNFDHHGSHSANSAPCQDARIRTIPADSVVEVSHMDADTFVGLLRMAGRELPKVDFLLMEGIDLNGSSVCPDKFDPTLLYMVGVGQLARELKFPRPDANGPVDVTLLVEAMFAKTSQEIVEAGRVATVASESSYRNCLKVISPDGKVGLWVIGSTDPLDPSRPYEDGVETVIVFRTHYASISIYCAPTSTSTFGGKTVAGVQFAGHPKAAGSPRGVTMDETIARKVFEEIASA